MFDIGQRLRRRARELALSDAEVARRAGLSERRYGNYVASSREPNFSVFLKLCDVLSVTPNDILLDNNGGDEARLRSRRNVRLGRIMSALSSLPEGDWDVAIDILDALAKRRSVVKGSGKTVPRQKSGPRRVSKTE